MYFRFGLHFHLRFRCHVVFRCVFFFVLVLVSFGFLFLGLVLLHSLLGLTGWDSPPPMG